MLTNDQYKNVTRPKITLSYKYILPIAELLKGGILGSRIPDILEGKSGHFSSKHILKNFFLLNPLI